ncbi:hypothetical protein IWZ01DRAFT_479544 [Phyllosticta capitalensis]
MADIIKLPLTGTSVSAPTWWKRTATLSGTLLGDLTTTFTPPSDCQNAFYVLSTLERSTTISDTTTIWTSTSAFARRAKMCSNSGIADTSTCWPHATESPPYNEFSGWGFYSPGFFCPWGYSTACASVAGLSSYSTYSLYSFGFAPRPGDTIAGCCPSSFTCGVTSSENQIQGCVQIVTYGTMLEVCGTTASELFTDPNDTPALSLDIILTAQAPMIQLNWKGEDRSSWHSQNPNSSMPISTLSAETGGLSTTAIIAMAVVVPVASLGLLIGAVVWFLRRRKSRRLRAPQESEERRKQDMGCDKDRRPELPHEGSAVFELSQPSVEMSDPHTEQLMQVQKKPAELPPDDV